MGKRVGSISGPRLDLEVWKAAEGFACRVIALVSRGGKAIRTNGKREDLQQYAETIIWG